MGQQCVAPTLFVEDAPALESVELEVIGIPYPQGSKSAIIINKFKPNQRAVIVEGSSRAQREKHEAWRTAVAMVCRQGVAASGREPIDEPVAMRIEFRFPLPDSDKYRTRHAATPDLDKLIRSTLDAIVHGGLLVNDSRVCAIDAQKRYMVEGETAGATIFIECLGPLEAQDRERLKREAKGAA